MLEKIWRKLEIILFSYLSFLSSLLLLRCFPQAQWQRKSPADSKAITFPTQPPIFEILPLSSIFPVIAVVFEVFSGTLKASKITASEIPTLLDEPAGFFSFDWNMIWWDFKLWWLAVLSRQCCESSERALSLHAQQMSEIFIHFFPSKTILLSVWVTKFWKTLKVPLASSPMNLVFFSCCSTQRFQVSSTYL